MKKAVLLVLLAAVLAGCEDFPIEGGDDIFRGHGGGRGDDLVQQHQTEQARAALDR